MFEKNIAIALYNKCRWEEAVEHIDKVFKYWNIKASPNRFLVIIKFVKNVIFILTGLDRVSKRAREIPGQRDNEVFGLIFMRTTALIYFDNVGLFFHTISGFNKCCTVDWSKSPDATRVFLGLTGVLSFVGLFFKLTYKLLDICNNKMDRNNIQNLMPFAMVYDLINICSGEWGKIAPFKETLLNDALKKGDLWNATAYLFWKTIVKIDQGDFNNAKRLIDKQSEIAVAYDYSLAAVLDDLFTTYLLLKKGQLAEAQKKAEQGFIFLSRHNMELYPQVFLSWGAQAQSLLNDVDGAKESLLKAKKIIDKHKFLAPPMIMPYFKAQAMMDIYLLKEALASNDRKNLSKLKKKAHYSGKKSLNNSKKYALDCVKALRLMGEYYWLIDKQKKALKWWDKAIKKGEELDARPDLSRTYFEIGKSLLGPESKYKDLNGITAEEYLKKARTMFEEMDLQWDLDELDKATSPPAHWP